MRRFIAVFSLCIFIFIHFLSFQPVYAVSSVDYGEMLNTYLGAAETALAASQGVTINWSNIDMPAGSDTWSDKEKAQYIVQYVGNLKKVGQHAIYDWLFGPDNDTQDVISAETAAIGLANSSNIDTFDIKSQLDQALLYYDQQNRPHVFQRYTDKVIARWNEYNTNYINDYIDIMSPVDPNPTYPDTDYQSIYQNTYNWIINSNTGNLDVFTTPINTTSYLNTSWNDRYNYSYVSMQSYITGGSSAKQWANIPIFSMNISDIRINGSGSSFTVTYPTFNFVNSVIKGNNLLYQFSVSRSMNNSLGVYQLGVSASNVTFVNNFTTQFDSLVSALNYVCGYFKNVNLYVNDVLWIAAGNNITSGLTINVPDAVIDNSSDDGKIVAHPIYYPDVMNTDKAIDIDLDKVIDAIASRIAQGADDITFDDFVDAGAAVKLDGTTLTDTDTVVKDVSVPIARAKVDTINGVIPTFDVVPPLPPLPPINPGDYSGEGFSGMSVLARIVNTTVQSLPAPIILTFFGVVFGAVILGIIKILHH